MPEKPPASEACFPELAGVRSSIELARYKAVRKANERKNDLLSSRRSLDQDGKLYLNDPSYNYWTGQVAMADEALGYIDLAERDL